MVAALDASVATILAAMLAMVGGLVAAVMAWKSNTSATESRTSARLVHDLMADRNYLRREVDKLRIEVDTLTLNSAETETALLSCRENEGRLNRRVADLEGRL